MYSKRFKYYQPNDKDIRDNYGDCTIRALSKAKGVSWLEAFDMMIPICRDEQTSNIFDVPPKKRENLLNRLGFEYNGISNKKGAKRPTVDEFARTHPSGTYIATVSHHVVAIVDGTYYDTWDCGSRSLYGFYKLKEE